MKLDRIILASDLNANYIQFWPLVSRVWQYVTGAKPTLFFIAPLDTPIEKVNGCDIIYVPPPPDLPPCFVAQTIRLLAPSWFPEEVCVVSDIDLMVVKPHFFPGHIGKYHTDQMVILNRYTAPQMVARPSLSYHVAQGKFWARLFHLTPGPQDWSVIFDQLRKWHRQYAGQWSTDEIILHEHVRHMQKQAPQSIVVIPTPHLWYRPHYSVTHYRGFQMDQSKLQQYIEVEPPAPYLKHRPQIHSVLQKLLPQFSVEQIPVVQSGVVRKNRHPSKQTEGTVKKVPNFCRRRPINMFRKQ
jgi:hypothetical protein